jgi:hypothetical protein
MKIKCYLYNITISHEMLSIQYNNKKCEKLRLYTVNLHVVYDVMIMLAEILFHRS